MDESWMDKIDPVTGKTRREINEFITKIMAEGKSISDLPLSVREEYGLFENVEMVD